MSKNSNLVIDLEKIKTNNFQYLLTLVTHYSI